MAVEQRRCLLSVFTNLRCQKLFGRHPNDFFNRRRHERLDPVEALDSAFGAPPIEQRLAILRRRNIPKGVANLVGIENARCVAVRIEKDERVRLVEIDILRQPDAPRSTAGPRVRSLSGENDTFFRGLDQRRSTADATFLASPLQEGERIEVRGFQISRVFLSSMNPHPPPLPVGGEVTYSRALHSIWAFQLAINRLVHRAP